MIHSIELVVILPQIATDLFCDPQEWIIRGTKLK